MTEIKNGVSVIKTALAKKHKITSDNITLLLISSGSADVYTHGRIFNAGYGSAFLFLPGEYGEVISKNAIAYKITFDDGVLSGESLRQLFSLSCRCVTLLEDDYMLLVDYISSLTAVSNRSEERYKKVVDKLFYAITTEFVSKKEIDGDIDDTPFGKICYFAENRPYSSQKLSEVATYSGLTVNYLCSLFKSKTGVSYNKYIKRKRLRTAEDLLLAGNQVKEVSVSCGYQSFSHFMSDFKEVFSITPNAYKKLHE